MNFFVKLFAYDNNLFSLELAKLMSKIAKAKRTNKGNFVKKNLFKDIDLGQ